MSTESITQLEGQTGLEAVALKVSQMFLVGEGYIEAYKLDNTMKAHVTSAIIIGKLPLPPKLKTLAPTWQANVTPDNFTPQHRCLTAYALQHSFHIRRSTAQCTVQRYQT